MSQLGLLSTFIDSGCSYEVHFLRPVYIDTLIFRSYEQGLLNHYFNKIETSSGINSGMNQEDWEELVPANSYRDATFQETFSPRLVKKIRFQGYSQYLPGITADGSKTGTNSDKIVVSDKLSVTKIQAYFANQLNAPPQQPTSNDIPFTN
jgi:hypothetical protein